jgi:hypothetical protein
MSDRGTSTDLGEDTPDAPYVPDITTKSAVDLPATVGSNLRRLRARSGYSLERLARVSGRAAVTSGRGARRRTRQSAGGATSADDHDPAPRAPRPSKRATVSSLRAHCRSATRAASSSSSSRSPVRTTKRVIAAIPACAPMWSWRRGSWPCRSPASRSLRWRPVIASSSRRTPRTAITTSGMMRRPCTSSSRTVGRRPRPFALQDGKPQASHPSKLSVA